jgi:riboflavin kinase/FMN adenylyltransferase
VTLRIVRGWRGLAADERGASVAFGNFDGVHRGHQRVIAAAALAARQKDAPLGVISFEPHPRRFHQPDAAPFQLMSLDQQARALDALGVDLLYVLPYGPEIAGMTDEEFAVRVLAEGLGVRHVTVGFDVTFGKGRSGDPKALKRYGRAHGFGVTVVDKVGDSELDKYSSSDVRQALVEGRPDRAAQILGRPFAIEGVVQRDRQLGRQLGFPTANVPMDEYVLPRLGVYATWSLLADGRRVPGVANLGKNPTVGAEVAPRLEVWLFDFDEDIYGQTLETELIAFLRPEEKFASIEALVTQVQADAKSARALLIPDIA